MKKDYKGDELLVYAEGVIAGNHDPESECPYKSGGLIAAIWQEGFADALAPEFIPVTKEPDPVPKVYPKIIRNMARCKKCGDTIESLYRHDYISCDCGALAVDGGKDYLRRVYGEEGDYEELSVYEEATKA